MSIGIPGKEGRAISSAQDLLAAFRNEHNFSLYDVHELLCPGMPMPLAGPSARGQFEKVDADLLEPRRYRQPMSNLVLTRRGERFRISRASRNGRAFHINLFFILTSRSDQEYARK